MADMIRKLLGYLPSNNMEDPPTADPDDSADRVDPALDTIVPDDPRKAYDMREIIGSLVDGSASLLYAVEEHCT